MLKIMVVEDEAIIAMDITMQIRELGHFPVGHATRGEQAIAMVQELQPDVVLMDVHLGKSMDGISAAIEIRSWFGGSIVFLSAFNTKENIARAQAAQPLGYITKPFDLEDLRTILSAVHGGS